ncbi:heavy metal-binding domain-containing protein [Mucilaginibacter sp. L196]|uniref:heavy metal-binding domain-containing protein n=1 Tax=Mucilaginibacter sp. L196 TaxID=1641870 RepID=UPI001C2041D2|nr:heavy metal-binding domain-containing protein [Mucilaginibacter sp. L196]
MKKVTLMAIAILFSGMTAFAAHSTNPVTDTTKTKKAKTTKIIYTCPMHTDVVSYKPGKCPKPGCGMTLVKKSDLKAKPAEKMKM